MTEWIWITLFLAAAGMASMVAIRFVHQRRFPGDERIRMRVVQSLHLGARERIVIVALDDVPHLFGIGGGQLTHLGRYDDLAARDAATQGRIEGGQGGA